jgi:mRNA interferase RelE/StbE
MPYTVIIENRAQRDFLSLQSPIDAAVRQRIDSLCREPRPHGVKKLSGTDDGHRVRVGDHRILYTMDDHHRVVTIYRIRHRREAYR